MAGPGKSKMNLENLPPTARSAHFHGLRVHYQIRMWSIDYSSEHGLDPCAWGWKFNGNKLVPVYTDEAVIPEVFENDIKCNCKAKNEDGQMCKSKACKCLKNGIKCFVSCGCHGNDCANSDVSFFCRI